MTATWLDGRPVAAQIRRSTAERAATLAQSGRPPALRVILAGEDPASAVYVKNKEKAALECGISESTLRFPETVSEAELVDEIHALNGDPCVDAILVQLPLPGHISTARIIETVDPSKDADGFHPFNAGRLLQGKPGPVPCTPAGIMELLKHENIDPKGMRAVVIGRSDIVGKPMALLLMHAHATVTVAHSRTRDLPAVAREADLLIAAMGKPAFVTGDFVKDGAIVIDVGVNRLSDRDSLNRYFPANAARRAEFDKKGSTLIGDCDPVTVFEKASRVTPVPGGVGPLTIAMLMKNSVDLAETRRERRMS